MEDSFGTRLKHLRAGKKLTQGDLAEQVGISKIQCSRYERDLAQPAADVVARISEVLEVSADYLLFGREDPMPAEEILLNQDLLKKFRELERLPESDRKTVVDLIEAFILRHRIKDLTRI